MAIGNPITLTNNVASKTISVTATADQTLFTVTGGYRINQLAVFRNGVRLADGADFTARDGSSVTLLSPANLRDTLEFQIFDDFRVADAIVSAATSNNQWELNCHWHCDWCSILVFSQLELYRLVLSLHSTLLVLVILCL